MDDGSIFESGFVKFGVGVVTLVLGVPLLLLFVGGGFMLSILILALAPIALGGIVLRTLFVALTADREASSSAAPVESTPAPRSNGWAPAVPAPAVRA